LLLQALFPEISIENSSEAEDSVLMKKALESTQNTIDIHHSGTAMRFLTAYFSIQKNREVILTGSNRMKERPIGILVEALRELGAHIDYLEKEGFPPLKIKGSELTKNKISIPADVSSQYISALMLIAPKLPNGLEITLEGNITSQPYIEMTLALLNILPQPLQKRGVLLEKDSQKVIKIYPLEVPPLGVRGLVESDWSSASYFYSIIALSEVGTEITLSSFKENSLQGDKILVEIYKDFGVETTFNKNSSITLSKSKILNPKSKILNLKSSPDLAQTIAVTCFGLGIGCQLTGLHTLKIKETDRLVALKNEIEKLGGKVEITADSLILEPNPTPVWEDREGLSTYQDHRMAMAFAPLALKTDLIIKEAEVVSKSYPKFWEDLKKLGFRISEI